MGFLRGLRRFLRGFLEVSQGFLRIFLKVPECCTGSATNLGPNKDMPPKLRLARGPSRNLFGASFRNEIQQGFRWYWPSLASGILRAVALEDSWNPPQTQT